MTKDSALGLMLMWMALIMRCGIQDRSETTVHFLIMW